MRHVGSTFRPEIRQNLAHYCQTTDWTNWWLCVKVTKVTQSVLSEHESAKTHTHFLSWVNLDHVMTAAFNLSFILCLEYCTSIISDTIHHNIKHLLLWRGGQISTPIRFRFILVWVDCWDNDYTCFFSLSSLIQQPEKEKKLLPILGFPQKKYHSSASDVEHRP